MTLMQAAWNIFAVRLSIIDPYEARHEEYGLGTAPMAAKQVRMDLLNAIFVIAVLESLSLCPAGSAR
jgi:hypothetical protein